MIAHVKIALLATAVVALVAACAAHGVELESACVKIEIIPGQPFFECAKRDSACVEIESVTGQPFFECPQEDDARITALQKKWLGKPDFRLRRAGDLGSLVVVPKVLVEQPLPPPSENPYWTPNEATKQRALRHAYELNGNSMVGGMIDVSDNPVVTGRTAITPETEYNVLDSQVMSVPDADICRRYGLRRVEINDGKGWRCRK